MTTTQGADELDLGVFLVVVLNLFQATIFIIPHLV